MNKITTNQAKQLFRENKPFYVGANKFPAATCCYIIPEQFSDFKAMTKKFKHRACNKENGKHCHFYVK